jgi:hypothetical protein
VSAARPRPQTAIISKAAKYVSDKRERETEDTKARAAGLLKWERVKVEESTNEVKRDREY